MQNNKQIILSLLLIFFTLISCVKKQESVITVLTQEVIIEELQVESTYNTNITDLNGTWHPENVYDSSLQLKEKENLFNIEQFSWGKGKYIIHTSNVIDISSEDPIIMTGSDGGFHVTDIIQINPSSIKVKAYQGRAREPEERTYIEFIFHFIDYNTLWMEENYFYDTDIYGKGNLWHRLSGPEKTE